jgi:hypothetical protein
MSPAPDPVHHDPSAPVIRLSDPSEMVAGLPALFGFRPRESLMFLAVERPRGRLGFRARIDLPTGPELEEAAVLLVGAAKANHVDAVIVLCHSEHTEAGEHAVRHLAGAFADGGVMVADVIQCDDSRFRSLSCTSADCCPPEGRPYDSTSSLLVAEAVGLGQRVLGDRSELANEVGEPDEATARRMSGACDRVRYRLVRTLGVDPARPDAVPPLDAVRAGAAEVKAVVAAALGAGPLGVSDDDVAALGVWCRCTTVRDVAWSLVDAGDPLEHLELWQAVARRTIAPFEPAVLSLVAFCAWRSGDGARAWCALDRALQADADYSMAHLLHMVLTNAMPPSIWQPVSEARVWEAAEAPD